MAVTTQTSTQLSNMAAGKKNPGVVFGGNLKKFDFDCVQSGAGATGSYMVLFKVPPGRWEFLPWLSSMEWTAGGTGVTHDVGYNAYTAVDGTTVTADTDAFDAAIDTSSAGHAALGTDLAAKSGGRVILESRTGVEIAVTSAAGIAASTEFHGYLVFSN